MKKAVIFALVLGLVGVGIYATYVGFPKKKGVASSSNKTCGTNAACPMGEICLDFKCVNARL